MLNYLIFVLRWKPLVSLFLSKTILSYLTCVRVGIGTLWTIKASEFYLSRMKETSTDLSSFIFTFHFNDKFLIRF